MSRTRIKIATAIGLIGLTAGLEIIQNYSTSALNYRERSELDIRFYDDKVCGSTAAADCGEVTGTTNDERLYSLLDHYAGLAQELQRQTGVPWELPFLHARGESGFCNTTYGDLAMLYDNYSEYNCFGLLESADGSYHMGAVFNTEHSNHINQMGKATSHYVQSYASIADSFASFFYDYKRSGGDDSLVFDESKVKDVKAYYDSYFTQYTGGIPFNSDYYRGSMDTLEKIRQYSQDKGWSSSDVLAESIPLGGLFPEKGMISRNQGWKEQSMHIQCDGTVTDNDGNVYVIGGGEKVAKSTNKKQDRVANSDTTSRTKAKKANSNNNQKTQQAAPKTAIQNQGLDSQLNTKFYQAAETTNTSSDGLTEEQAQSLIDWYIDTSHNNELDLSASLGTHCNCVSMSNYFVQKFTTLKFGSNDGFFVVDSTLAANPEKELEIEYSSNISKIRIPSVFSDREGSGHTGVIVGYDSATQEYISIEANWNKNTSVQNDMMQIEGCGTMNNGKLNAGYIGRKTLAFYKGVGAKFLYIPEKYINQEALEKIANGRFSGSDKCETAFKGDFPFMSQADPRWGKSPYPPGNDDGGTYQNSGCGITSFAMIATYLEGEEITPVDVYERTGIVTYSGNPIGDMAKHYNMEAVNVTETDLGGGATNEQIVAAINKYLNDGYLIELSGKIASGKNGVFSDKGHYIVLYGRDSKGEWLMADPGHKDNNGKAWDPMKLVGMGINRGNGETKIWALKSAGD